MNKQEFLSRLREALAGLPEEDVGERLAFYEEMIDDRMEEGLPEEEAVAAVGSVEAIVTQAVEETPLAKIVRERVRTRQKGRGWQTALIILGFPLWLPLLIAGFAVLFSLYIVLWSLVISLWAVWASLLGAALGCVGMGVVALVQGAQLNALVFFSAAAVLAGLGILLFFVCRGAGRGAWILTKQIAWKTKSLFLRKENGK